MTQLGWSAEAADIVQSPLPGPKSGPHVSGSDVVPGPRGSRWLGLARDLQRDQLGTYDRAVAEYGDVVRLAVGPPGLRRDLYLVTHPDGVEQVLAGDPDSYSKNTPTTRRSPRTLATAYSPAAGHAGGSSAARSRRYSRTGALTVTSR